MLDNFIAAWTAVAGLWPALLLNAIFSSAIGLLMAVRMTTPDKITKQTFLSVFLSLSFLLYPRPVLISTIQIGLSRLRPLLDNTPFMSGIAPFTTTSSAI